MAAILDFIRKRGFHQEGSGGFYVLFVHLKMQFFTFLGLLRP